MVDASSCIFCCYLQLQVNSNKKPLMKRNPDKRLALLVVEDVAETRDGIEKLLNADGYHVALARDEQDAIERALLKRPNLILVSLAGPSAKVVATACIRELADLGEQVPIVVFCVGEIAEGDEVAIGQNVHLTRPDNFNQLRSVITRLLPHSIPKAA